MPAPRWALGLPRASSSFTRSTRQSAKRLEKGQNWTTQKRLPPSRPLGSKPGNVEKSNDDFTQRMRQHNEKQQDEHEAHQVGRNAQLSHTLAQSDTSDLVSEVHIPRDPDGVLPEGHPALALLGNSSLVIQRQIEMMNVMLGFEQANRYIIMDGAGQTIGYIAEQDHGIGSTMTRQLFKTHRSFTTHIFDAQEREVLRIHRPFAYINSRIRIYDPVPEGGYQATDTSTALQGTSVGSVANQSSVAQISPLKLDEMRIIGEAQQQWAPLRRKYNLFSYRPLSSAPDDSATQRIESGERPTSDTMAVTEAKAPEQAIEAGMLQFAHVNEPFLSWDFNLRSESGDLVGSVNRNFAGFAREIFTDTGVYALRMDSAAQSSVLENASGQEVATYEKEATAMTLDQRAVMLATAVSIDFDYFSRHSGAASGGGFMPIFWPMGGGTAAEGGAAGAGAGAAGGAAEAGTAVGAAEGAGAIGGAASRGLGTTAAESGMAGAGTMAGYEAMQRGAYGRGQQDDASPTNNEPFENQPSQQQPGGQQEESVWGENDDPWGEGPGDGPPPSAGGEGGGGEGGGGLLDAISDFFGD